MKRLLLLLFVGSIGGTAVAGDYLAVIFGRFSHQQHAASLNRSGVECVACHAVGAASGDLRPAPGVCHSCHAPGEGGLGEGEGLRRAPRQCSVCHPVVAAPESHAAGWLALHGPEARSDARSCTTCHTRSSCIDCHDRRQNGAFAVHDPSWIRTHGIAARAAPATCDTCHTQSECLACHTSSAGFGRVQ